MFQAYRGDDSLVRNLVGTQVALHQQRLAYNTLLACANIESEAWIIERARLVSCGMSVHMKDETLHIV